MSDCFFFFKQKTAYEIGTGDWSSDVCSSDLMQRENDYKLELCQGARGGYNTELRRAKINILKLDRKSVV